ncbi:MAG: GMC family oxidoreductase [Woeseiaceae bacterium]|jgi:choline dehydrogenase-like flavoprotein|nr:GMC family oxidoreductase [Woeseiaceae bacterium]
MSKTTDTVFDAIVVGSGMSGGWAAKELTERGLKVLLLERGPNVEHRKDYVGEGQAPWQLPYRDDVPESIVEKHYSTQARCYAFRDSTRQFFVKDSEAPYATPEGKPFDWIRGYHLGGRSLTWHRQSYRLSDIDFEANKAEGIGVDWPIRYEDIAPWYDHVETFAGITGSVEGLPQLPDGKFQPPMQMNCVEKAMKAKLETAYPDRRLIIGRAAHLTAPTEEQTKLGRMRCQYRNECQRGCSFGAYFSSLSATLPAARNTGNLTTITDAVVESVVHDAETGRVTGVRVIDAGDAKARRQYRGKLVFLCASTLASTQIMLNSRSERFPNGIANDSGTLGRFLMDHIGGVYVSGVMPGFLDQYHKGRRPTGCYLPRFRNVNEPDGRFRRGFGYQGGAVRLDWRRGRNSAGIGETLKADLRQPGPWVFGMAGFGEMLPYDHNRVWLDEKQTDRWGMPILNIDCTHGANEEAMLDAMAEDGVDTLEAAGLTDISVSRNITPPGLLIHEMGTARMGRDPATSVLNQYNQAHSVANLFVTDGACMTSSACQNPSLTYMALTARAAHAAADMLAENRL